MKARRMTERLKIGLPLLLALLLLLALAGLAHAATWQIQTVDSAGRVGADTSLALDSSGNPHISYSDITTGGLKYAAWNGSSWQIQTVDTSNLGSPMEQFTSLALDGSGNPHISYSNATNPLLLSPLKYAYWDGSGWRIQTVDGANSNVEYPSLALDSSGNPHISYQIYYGNSIALRYASWNGSSWQIETVDSTGDVGAYDSLALDSSGNPHISYYDQTNGVLKYASWNGSSWQIETVDNSAGGVGLYSSLALDGSDNPHISYMNFTTSREKYAAWDGNTWQIQIVDSEPYGYFNGGTSLALDGSGNPHISYPHNFRYCDPTPYGTYCHYNIGLKYAAWDGSGWKFQKADSQDNIDVGGYPSLALDSSGNPHISYYNLTNGDLKYAALIADTTPPAISASVSGTLGNNGWYTSNVAVSWTVTDNESAISSTSGCKTTTISSDTAGTTLTCTATSAGGTNSASVTVKRDATPPTVSVTGVAGGATYILGSVPTAGCDTSDALSGVATPASLSLTGGNPDGSGTFTATCSGALDKAGNSGSASLTYTVITPQQAITNLENDIQSLVDNGTLKTGQATGLTQPLDNAIRSLNKGYTDDACNQLDDFIVDVNQSTPTPLDAATAANLIASAQAIQTAIGCP